jgi:hypothetical protein
MSSYNLISHNEMIYPLKFRQQALAIRKRENLTFKQTAERSGVEYSQRYAPG